MPTIFPSTRFIRYFIAVFLSLTFPGDAISQPESIKVVLNATSEIQALPAGRLPLYVLPISGSLDQLTDQDHIITYLKALSHRGIAYSVNWRPHLSLTSIAQSLQIAQLQSGLGMQVVANASACLNYFFDGSQETGHIDAQGQTFFDHSCGRPLGCPFALDHRLPVMKGRVENFVRSYSDSRLPLDFVFVDWEIDGPIEWNESWAASRRCQRCCSEIPDIQNFTSFQSALRTIRSRLQMECFSRIVLKYFPRAMVGNYAVYPHNGVRYWYDYFEEVPTDPAIPVIQEHSAIYRKWVNEFSESGYTVAMPVIYPWYRQFDWYNFDNSDFRWLFGLLKVGANAAESTPASIPSIPFVHWHTTTPPEKPSPHVIQLSAEKYQSLLWHLMLRGHDSFFLWCLPDELSQEIKLVHEVFAQSLAISDCLIHGTPIHLEIPSSLANVKSELRYKMISVTHTTNFIQP